VIVSAMMIHWKNARRRWDEGAAAIEAALVFPLLVLVILGIIEFGMALWQWNTMLLAVEQAGRFVMVNNTSCDVACAENQMQAVLPSASVCTIPASGQLCVSASATASTMKLSAAYGFNLLSLFQPFTITTEGTVPLD
jgi:Flp pilus assembly protein TadG